MIFSAEKNIKRKLTGFWNKSRSLFLSALCILSCNGTPERKIQPVAVNNPGKGIKAETRTVSSGNKYLILHQGKNRLDFEIKRPDEKDTSLLLCIAAAFTQLDSYAIDGVYIHKGKIHNKEKVNHRLGGAIKIENGVCTIFPTDRGKLLTDSLLNKIAASKGSLFQQIQVVVNGKAESFTDTKVFQRRAIVLFNDKSTAIVESEKPITLKSFSNDLVELGAYNALYTDMGNWDEGWYRDSEGKIVRIGTSRAQTDKQSNWVVFKQ